MARQSFQPNLVGLSPGDAAPAASGLLTVSQVTALVKDALEAALPATLHVVGEISNFKRHSSGHLYFTIKDRYSELGCVMWRSQAGGLKFAPSDGMEVIATGNIEVFERAGRYQLYVRKLEPRGVGALELAFRQLCEKLEREGLFDPARKRSLPRYPQRIAVVTSPTGAAIADMLRTINRRYPCVDVLVYPVRVQGSGAAEEIARGIRHISTHHEALGGIDLMIVGRGGGSLEDLWAFNEEAVARAIFASRIPVVSAVGHEVDVTIADLVADVRAATPTAAAELAVPVLDEVLADLAAHEARLRRAALSRFELSSARLAGLMQRRGFREPLMMIHRREQVLDELGMRLHRRLAQRVHNERTRLNRLEPVIERIAPHLLWMRRAVALRDAQHRILRAVAARLAGAERAVARSVQRLDRSSPVHRLHRLVEQVEQLGAAIHGAWRFRASMARERLRRQEDVLHAMSYKNVLRRGFSITRLQKGNTVVRSVRQLLDRQPLVTEVADGTFQSEVVNLNQLELFG